MKPKWSDRAAKWSLVLCVVTCAFWALGYWRYLGVTRVASGGSFAGVAVRSGNFVFQWGTSPLISRGWHLQNDPPDPLHPEVQNRGVIHATDKRSGATWTLVYVPLWLLFVALGLMPAYRAIVTRRTRYRLARRRCPTCAYDLTGNASGVCPECGTPVEAAALTRGSGAVV